MKIRTTRERHRRLFDCGVIAPRIKRSHERCIQTDKAKLTCEGARRTAQQQRRRYHTNHGEYHCVACGWFHVGSSIKGRKTR